MNPFQCVLCTATFKSKKQLILHGRTNHGLRHLHDVVCDRDECDWTGYSGAERNEHKRVSHQRIPISCDVDGCYWMGSTMPSMKRHKDEDHPKPLLTCDVVGCEWTGSTKVSIKRHKKEDHVPARVHCKVEGCTWDGTSEWSLRIHKRDVHSAASTFVTCPVCEVSCRNQKLLAKHAAETHASAGQNFHVQTSTFQTEEDFNNWLATVEVNAKCNMFVNNFKGSTRRFACSRSGKTETVDERAMKRVPHGTKKEHSHCTAYISARINEDGAVVAEYVLDHLGHEVSIGQMRLSDSDVEEISELLKTKHNPAWIRNFLFSTKTPEERLHYVSYGDVMAVSKRKGLSLGLRHNDDLASVKLEVEDDTYTFPVYNGAGFVLVEQTLAQKEILDRLEERANRSHVAAVRQLTTGKPRWCRSHQNHLKAAQDFGPDFEKVAMLSERHFTVQSASCAGVEYAVRRTAMECSCSQTDNMHCRRCSVCPYGQTCSCPEGGKSGVPCKHCHAVFLWLQRPKVHHGQHDNDPHVEMASSGEHEISAEEALIGGMNGVDEDLRATADGDTDAEQRAREVHALKTFCRTHQDRLIELEQRFAAVSEAADGMSRAEIHDAANELEWRMSVLSEAATTTALSPRDAPHPGRPRSATPQRMLKRSVKRTVREHKCRRCQTPDGGTQTSFEPDNATRDSSKETTTIS